MKSRVVGAALVLFLMVIGVLAAPVFPHASVAPRPLNEGRSTTSMFSTLSHTVTPSTPLPRTSFPRTVMIETFTGVWCPHCPTETIGLHNVAQTTTTNLLAIAELHSCYAGPTQCYENYQPPDGTTGARFNFYGACGFPDVFFDGGHDVCGGPAPPITQAEINAATGVYQRAFNNASAIPANVSIAQTSVVVGKNVTDHAVITSGINGSYNVITYLLENIDKHNQTFGGSGPHDVDWAVRETLRNHPLNLTVGGTVEVNSTGAINSTWKNLNLSVVTFVQQNTTKHIENANFSLVHTLATGISVSHSTVVSLTNSTVSISVVNTSTQAPVVGAAVTFASTAGGNFTPASGVTGTDGTFSSTFTAPNVSGPTSVVISAQVTSAGYTPDSASTSLTVNPVGLSTMPTALTLTPGVLQVTLNWTTPAAGGVGVSYDVYRSTTQTGGYSLVGVTYPTRFTDMGLPPGQSYWYKVNARGPSGFSGNTTPISATSITLVPQGLGPFVGWWVAIASANLTSSTNSSMVVYLPRGTLSYTYGAASYGYIASGTATPISVEGISFSVPLPFSLRFATLRGTVNPPDAALTLNGASVSVSAGSFLEIRAAGTYWLNASSPGYHSKSLSVTLTPGNTTTVSVQLQISGSTSGVSSSSNGGLTNDQVVLIIGAIAVILAVAVVVAVIMSRRGKGAAPPPDGGY